MAFLKNTKIIIIILLLISTIFFISFYFSPAQRIKRSLARGDALLNKGKTGLAIEEAQKILDIDPKNSKAFLLLGKAYIHEKHYGLALEKLSNAVEIDPDSAEIYYFTGVAYKGKGEFNTALKKFDKGEELLKFQEESNNLEEKIKSAKIDTYIEYGKTLAEKGKLYEGEEKLKKAIKLDGTNQEAHMELLKIYIKEDEMDLALEECKNMMDIKTGLGIDAFYTLAKAYKNKALNMDGLDCYKKLAGKITNLIDKESNFIVKKLLQGVKIFVNQELEKMEKKQQETPEPY